jgi:hypothetical protein
MTVSKPETIAGGSPPTCEDCNITPKLSVCHSAAGYYVGTRCDCGPYSRESGYYKKHEQAEAALASSDFGREAGLGGKAW